MCNLSFLFLLAFLTTSILITSSFKIDDDAMDLFAWAKHHGAKISPNIKIQNTPYGGRGLFAGKSAFVLFCHVLQCVQYDVMVM